MNDEAYWAQRCKNCGRKRSEHSIPFEYVTLDRDCKPGFELDAPSPKKTPLEESIDAYFRGDYLVEK